MSPSMSETHPGILLLDLTQLILEILPNIDFLYVLTSVKGAIATTGPLMGWGTAAFRVQVAYQMLVY